MEELRHHKRIADMMLTMHSALRDMYERRLLIVECLLLIASVVVVTRLFLDENFFLSLGIKYVIVERCARLAAILLFTLTILILKIDWRGKGAAHKQAADSLGRMKSDIKSLLSTSGAGEAQVNELCKICRGTLNSLVKIPENRFIGLKALHRKKVLVSKLLDRFPTTPIVCLRLSIWRHGLGRRIEIADFVIKDDGAKDGG